MKGILRDRSGTSSLSSSGQHHSHHRRESARPQQHPGHAIPASTQDRQPSRRRNMAFLKYGSEEKLSTSTLKQTRAHAKQIAMKLTQEHDSGHSPHSTSTAGGGRDAFADFGSAFPRSFHSNNSTNTAEESESTISFFDEDPFGSGAAPAPASFQAHSLLSKPRVETTRLREEASPRQSLQQEETFSDIMFEPRAITPTRKRTMFTMPSNSSMQATFSHQSPRSTTTSTAPGSPSMPMPVEPQDYSPLSRPQQASPSQPLNGAAARRRMKTQMKAMKGGAGSSGSVRRNITDSELLPQSPLSLKRIGSSETMSSALRKAGNHLPNYSVSGSSSNHRVVLTPTTHRSSGSRSVGSSANRSTNSSHSSSEVNLFETDISKGGFTFDAFGLDESQFHREVSEAMHDLAGSTSDFSFFTDHDPADDFAAGRWDSPIGSRSSTPALPGDEEDGFVDGFRVTKPSPLPIHVRQSPTSTERSSLTSDSSDRYNNNNGQNVDGGRVNLFKEKAGFSSSKPKKVVRPTEDTDEHDLPPRKELLSSSSGGDEKPNGFRKWTGPNGLPKMPELSEEPLNQNKQRDVDFYSDDGAVSDVSQSSRLAPRPRSLTGAQSDVGVASDVGVVVPEESDMESDSCDETPPLEKDMARGSGLHLGRQHSPQEEKKLDDLDVPLPSVGSLKSQWEKLENPIMVYESRSLNEAQLPLAHPLRAQTEARTSLQGNLQQRKADGGNHISREVAPYRPDECVEQRHSLASANSRLQPAKQIHAREAAPKSEGGGILSSRRHVAAILSRLDKESPSEDAKSDAGPSPSFHGITLRKTGLTLDGSPGRSIMQDMRDYARSSRLSPSKNATSDSKANMRVNDSASNRLRSHQYSEAVSTDRREMDDNREERSQRDVAAFLERRVNATKSISETHKEVPLASDGQFNGRGPVAIGKDPEMRRSLRGESSEVDEDDEQPEKSQVSASRSEAASAVSRLLMMQQLQNPGAMKLRSVKAEQKSALSLSVLTEMSSLVENDAQGSKLSPDDTRQRTPKATTPKATMMMLNAFLAGRESLSSSDPAGQSRGPADEQDQSAEENGVDSTSQPRSSLPALKDDPKYERYFKMLKLGMPMDVVKHAMTRDGLDPAVMDGDHNLPAGVPLKDDPTYEKYFRMIKIGLPMEAVKHAMARDGLDPLVMDQDHNLPAASGARQSNESEEPQEKDSHRRARLHWKPLRKVTSNSLWAKLDGDAEVENIEIDEEEFQELFQLDRSIEHAPKTTTSSANKKGATVRVIDPKRANNGGIILARLKMSHDEMADAVDRIDETAMTAEQIEHMIEYLPTKDERKALESYMLEGGQDAAEKFDGLCECEKFMVSMMTVKHAKRKVRALLFKLQLETCLEDIQKDALAVESACDELSNSVRLRQLLGIILTFGNRLNTAGNGKRKAGAFTLDSLLKLNQAKAFDKKTTFLHYIVLIVRRNNELLLRYKDDLQSVFKADKVYWDQCVSDLEEVENQLENVRKLALYQARHSHYYRLKKKKNREDDEESLSDGEISLSLEEEVEALRATPIGLFTLSAIKYVSALREKVEETNRKFARLLEYFGEEDKSKQPHELFNIVVSFTRDFDKAKEQVLSNEKRKQREDRKRQANSSGKVKSPSGRPPAYSPGLTDRKSGEILRASNHQPTISAVLREMKPHSPHHREEPNDVASSIRQEPGPSPRMKNVANLGEVDRGLNGVRRNPKSPYRADPSWAAQEDIAVQSRFAPKASSPFPVRGPQNSTPAIQSQSSPDLSDARPAMLVPVKSKTTIDGSNGSRRPEQDAVYASDPKVMKSPTPIDNSAAVNSLRQKARQMRHRYHTSRSSSTTLQPSLASPKSFEDRPQYQQMKQQPQLPQPPKSPGRSVNSRSTYDWTDDSSSMYCDLEHPSRNGRTLRSGQSDTGAPTSSALMMPPPPDLSPRSAIRMRRRAEQQQRRIQDSGPAASVAL